MNVYRTYLPDIFNGDPITEEQISTGKFDRAVWGAKHGKEQINPLIDAVIKGLNERGITAIGGSAYCTCL